HRVRAPARMALSCVQTPRVIPLSKLQRTPLLCSRVQSADPYSAVVPMIRSAIAAAGLALLPLAAVFPQQRAGAGRDDATFIWSKALASGATVSIRNADGSIDVRESPNDRVEVRAVKRPRNSRAANRDISFDVRESGGDVSICTVYDGSSLCDDRGRGNRNINVAVHYTVLIPRSMRVRLTTGNGEISVDKAGAEVVATTGNGRVNIGETTGRVDATTG